MSYLSKKIDRCFCMEERISQLKKDIEKDLKSLNESENHRVVDDDVGGCLMPPRRIPTVRTNGFLACRHPDLNSEEVLKRAIFNSGDLSEYKLIAQEAPFFRKWADTKNMEIPTRQLSCDLVGRTKTELCCIELKTNPEKDCTQIPYALLEAYSYWVCADWIFKNRSEDFGTEIAVASKRRQPEIFEVTPIEKVTFAVAFPQQYVDEHGAKFGLLIEHIEKAFKKICPSAFVGYFILSGTVKKSDEIDGYYVPLLEKPLQVIKHKTVSKFL